MFTNIFFHGQQELELVSVYGCKKGLVILHTAIQHWWKNRLFFLQHKIPNGVILNKPCNARKSGMIFSPICCLCTHAHTCTLTCKHCLDNEVQSFLCRSDLISPVTPACHYISWDLHICIPSTPPPPLQFNPPCVEGTCQADSEGSRPPRRMVS